MMISAADILGKRYSIFPSNKCPSCSPYQRIMITHDARSVIQARLNISAGEFRVFLQNVLKESPAARNSKTVCTVMRVPRTTGRPLQTSGLIEIRSDMFLQYINHLANPRGKPTFPPRASGLIHSKPELNRLGEACLRLSMNQPCHALCSSLRRAL